MNERRGNHGICRIKDTFYVFGGFNGDQLDKNECLDLNETEWCELPDLERAFTDVCVVVL